MNRIPRNAIIGAALVMGLLAALLLYLNAAKQPKESVVTTARVVTAKSNITTGAILGPEMLQLQTLPIHGLPADALTDFQAVSGKIAVQDIEVGAPVTAAALSESNRLSQMIPRFMRAVTVAVDPIIGVGGYLNAGDRVDVIATFNVNEGTLTKTVLQNVLLIAMGSEVVEQKQSSSEPTAKTEPKTQTNATLAVMPSEAEKLVLAEAKGKLRLVLRRSDDSSYSEVRGITSRAMLGVVPPDVPPKASPRAPSPVALPAMQRQALPPLPVQPPLTPQMFSIKPREPVGPRPEPKKTIEIIRGTKVEETTVDR